MGSELPKLPYEDFARRLRRFLTQAESPLATLSEVCIRRLHRHYEELTAWNPRLSLIGPGTSGEVVERHYGESLLGAGLLLPTDQALLDLGSGAGFPGLPLAAARPELDIHLVESREKKCAFLRTAIRRCSLSCQCLNARVQVPLPKDLPEGINVIVSRAVRLDTELLAALLEAYPGARCLLWQAGQQRVGAMQATADNEQAEADESMSWLPRRTRVHRTIRIPGSRRWIVELIQE